MEKKNLSLYIHIPFCVRKCEYCDFLSMCKTPEEQAYYVRNLIKEIRNFAAISSLYKVKTIFFGGGTPSVLEPVYIENILQAIRTEYDVFPDVEISLEANPGTLTADKLKAYRSMGINRISLGLQSASDEELTMLGRIHTYNDFLNNYALLRRLGFDNINVDIMSALPGQSVNSYMDTLSKVALLNPEHISAYSLQIEPGTPFYKKYGNYPGKAMLPNEEEERKMYHLTNSFLTEKGYSRYEISNYAREGFECKHNLVYWSMDEYLGFGLGASSFIMNRRFSNPRSFEEYYDYCKKAYESFKSFEPESEKSLMEEYMFLGLRKVSGISVTGFEKMFNKSFNDIYGAVIQKLSDEKLITYSDDKIKLTDFGIDVSNMVLAEFLL